MCFQETVKHAVINEDGSLWTIGFEYDLNGRSHYQIGMTGTCKRNETMYSGLKRELSEELGVEIIRKPQQHMFICKNASNTYKQDWLVCVVQVDNLRVISIQIPEKSTRDDRTKKVGAIIIGSRKEIIDLIQKSIDNWPEVGKSDNIQSIVAMPLDFIWSASANRKIIYNSFK